MIAIRIHAWHPDKAWATYGKQAIVSRFQMYTDMKQRHELEAVAQQILARACVEIPLARARDRYERHELAMSS
jgi:hypothetical protein